MEEIDPIHDLEQRRAEERRAVDEAGGGEAEGFEQAEQELIEHASHGDEHNTTPIFRDAEGADRGGGGLRGPHLRGSGRGGEARLSQSGRAGAPGRVGDGL